MRLGGPCQGPKRALSKPKKPSWSIKGPLLAEKDLLEPNRVLTEGKKDLLSAQKDIFIEERVYLAPMGTLELKKGPFGDEKGHFGAKGSRLELKWPL